MGNAFVNLPVPPTNGIGAAQDTSALGELKTVTVQGAFEGAIYIEISCGGSFKPLATVTQSGKYRFPVAAKEMRVRRENTIFGQPTIEVASSDPGGMFIQLPQDGSSVDVSAFGTFNTVVLGQLIFDPLFGGPGVVFIEISENNVNWTTCMVFTQDDHQSKRFTARYMRVRSPHSAVVPDVWVGAIDEDTAALDFGPPVTVEGSNNQEGVSEDASRADHKHRLELKVSEDGSLVGQRPEVSLAPNELAGIIPASLVISDNAGQDRVDVEIGVDKNAIEAGVDFGVPITVRGPTNAAGASDFAHADHDHRLELEVADEGALAGARPTINFIGTGVGAVDNPGLDRVDITITGGSLTDDAVVKRSTYVDADSATSSNTFVDGMVGTSVAVPIDGDYWAIFESECCNQAASGIIEIGISVNSLVAVVANSERESQGPAANKRPVLTTVQLTGLLTGQLVRALFRKKSGAGSVELHRRHLTIIKVQ